jgi:PAS domain S-box-containing protein
MRTATSSIARNYGVGLLAAAIGITLRLALSPALGNAYPYIFTFPAVAAVAYYAGFGPAVFTMLVSELAVDYFLIPPIGSLVALGRAEAFGIALSLLSCILIIIIIEAVRRQSPEEVNQILESISDCFYALDENWNFTYVNSQAIRYFGRRREELLARNFWQLMPEKKGTTFESSFTTAARIGQVVQFEALSPVTHRWVDAHVYPSANGISVFFRDTTEALRAKIGENRLSAILNSATDAIITIDASERITLFSRGAEHIFRCPSSAALGQKIETFIPQRFRSQHHDHIRAFAQTGISVRQMGGQRVLRALRMDGEEFPMEAQISQTEVGGERLLTVILRDITDRVRLENEREQLIRSAQEAAEAAARANQAKDDFLSMASHELRNPLTPILLSARMLRTSTVDEVVVHKAAERIERNALSQAQLIEDLLDVSRITAGKLRLDVERVELAPVIENAVDSVRTAADARNIQLRVVTDPRAGFVSGDKERLQQIVWNLLSNAIKFTPRGGQVEVLVQRVNSHLEIVVRDTGQGILPEFLPHVFERFRQADSGTKRAYGGLGLGLAIVRNLVELHGGTVTAESAGVGCGSIFTVALPLAAIQAASAPDRVHPAVSRGRKGSTLDIGVRLQGLHVMVVDDDPGILEALDQTLSAAGAMVRTCSSAREALTVIKNWRPAVIVCDIGMPEEDGYSLIRKIRALPREDGGVVPALALTAFARVEDRIKVLSSGFQMHVAKPVQSDELITAIANLSSPPSDRL